MPPRGVELVRALIEVAAPLPTEPRGQRESRCPIAYINARTTATEFLGTIREETRENARLIEDGGNRCSPNKKMTKSGGKIPKKSATFHGLQDLRKCKVQNCSTHIVTTASSPSSSFSSSTTSSEYKKKVKRLHSQPPPSPTSATSTTSNSTSSTPSATTTTSRKRSIFYEKTTSCFFFFYDLSLVV
ncbi:Protein CBG20935 [Caenorhabditis briggsae]|uniref:Protein CBG20935 n=1 Tax=Caenorhabditis briggsae TaxID=6238 RepID=A8XYZ9_CAEBR|nr:Protein CBG20935 [Caenorhabditis briggsae]CAP37866.1 Protein CBG20935 [Caenorhabditis briggsae]